MTGTPFAGRKASRQGGVLLIAVEGQDEVRLRLAAAIQEKAAPKLDPEDAAAMPFAWVEVLPAADRSRCASRP